MIVSKKTVLAVLYIKRQSLLCVIDKKEKDTFLMLPMMIESFYKLLIKERFL